MSLESAAPRGLDPRFPALDSLRAVGALAVLTTHVGFESGAYTRYDVLGPLLARLDAGVAIFFVLSGFLLARPHLAAAQHGLPRPTTGRYFWKRALRILPVYLVTALLALALYPANDDLGLRDWLLTLLLVNTYVDPLLPAGLTHMWSLAVEVAFYLCLPALMLLALGRGRGLAPRRVAAVLAGLVAVSLWWHLDGAAYWDDRSTGLPLQWLPAYLTWFAVGIGLALVHVRHVAGSGSRLVAGLAAAGRQPGSCWAMAAGVLLVASTPVAGPVLLVAPTASESLAKDLLYAVLGGLVVLPGIFAAEDSAFGRLTGARWARHLGLVSYSLFCIHMSLLHLVREVFGWQLFGGHLVPMWLVVTAVSLAAAELLYRLVEVPAMRWRNLPPPRLRRRPGTGSLTGSGTGSPTGSGTGPDARTSRASTGTSSSS